MMKKPTAIEVGLVTAAGLVLAIRGGLAVYAGRAWIAPRNSPAHLMLGPPATSFGIAQISLAIFLISILGFYSRRPLIWKVISAVSVAVIITALALSLTATPA